VVTGAAQGIGRAIAERFLAAGDRVASLDRCAETTEGGILQVCADVRDTASVDAAFTTVEQAHGPVDIVVANAGITRDGLLMRMSDEDFETVLDVNLTGAFRVVRRASTSMIRRRSGRVVLIASVVGLYGGAGQVNYSSSKAGLVGLARSVTRELGGRGITANVVAPGFIDTAMTEKLPDDLKKQYLTAIPAGRWGTPDDVMGPVVFLASPASDYVNGYTVAVDGGWLAR